MYDLIERNDLLVGKLHSLLIRIEVGLGLLHTGVVVDGSVVSVSSFYRKRILLWS